MPLRTPLFRRISIIGVGLMGGSLGLAIKKQNIAREVVGFSHTPASLAYAVEHKIIDQAASDLKTAVHNADLVILATPVKTIVNLLPMLAPHLSRYCIVTDVGSTKSSIVQAALKNLPSHQMFVGSHPLAGSEKKGASHASAELFEGTTCIMTPTEQTNRLAKDKLKHFWTSLGAQVKFLPPEQHDKILSYVSHLPHLVAYAVIEAIPAEHLEFSAQGLKDTTRIASSSPQMWNDICLANPKNIVKSLDEVVKNLSAIRKMIMTKDEQGLNDYFHKSKTKRDSLEKRG
ncbi:MAG: hypothetical protein A2787_03370 [Omnitrophica WOR_2 bacterium RIFCSPHIGHO2_01_FULL_48_9]|nr:MAG: hypothetical protein A3D10_00975 [Omnitrophica WOR_2 bacterium RIFCSPHIGHO2_02_FULL_48_11]OGX32055.1 MAG: hypothetical protein A2787_03370 [Omnitrophica WOR_2 bacterium RIFCSPHIGHO2_01_FULL_48_9]